MLTFHECLRYIPSQDVPRVWMYLYELNVAPCTRCTPSTVISPDSTSSVQLSREVYATSRHRNIFSISSYIQISRKSGSPVCERSRQQAGFTGAHQKTPLSNAKLLPPFVTANSSNCRIRFVDAVASFRPLFVDARDDREESLKS